MSHPSELITSARDPEPALRLLSVHAHPDDEASKGASLVARLVAEGAGATLVCCTGGELGEVLNPAMDRPEVVDRLAEVRLGELRASAEVIGFDRVDLLGYRDSGMAGDAANDHPECFWQAPIDDAVGRLVRLIRRDRPQVILTYSDDASLLQALKEGIRLCYSESFRKEDVAVVTYSGRNNSRLLAYDRIGPHTMRRFTGEYDLLGAPVPDRKSVV